jgi:hypothetical protein
MLSRRGEAQEKQNYAAGKQRSGKILLGVFFVKLHLSILSKNKSEKRSSKQTRKSIHHDESSTNRIKLMAKEICKRSMSKMLLEIFY